jgi:hypothetical protein
VTNVGDCDLPARGACGGFSYGTRGTASITGACSTAPAGATVNATATLNGVSLTTAIGGTCTP